MFENDKEIELPLWKQKLDALNKQKPLKDIAYQNSNDYLIKEEEVALKHPTTEAIIKLTDDGYIDLFAGPTLGIRLDPKTNSINFFGDTANFLVKNMNLVTKPNGFSWNGYYFNPELYIETGTERRQVLEGTKEYYHLTHEPNPKVEWHRDPWSIRPMVQSDNKRRFSDGMVNLITELGLPIE